MKAISVSEAKKNGLSKYFTGNPCKRGHVAERYVFGGCCECKRQKDQKNRQKNAAYNRDYRAANLDLYRLHMSKRRAAMLNRTPAWFGELDEFVMQQAIELAEIRKEVSGLEWHVDHMIPLRCDRVSGLHCAANLQVIPASLNRQKRHRFMLTEPGEWIGRC